jgi:type II restriction enzyme
MLETNQKVFEEIENRYYFAPIKNNFERKITHPQQMGMLNFFDFVYLTKLGNFISPINEFSKILSDLNALYK